MKVGHVQLLSAASHTYLNHKLVVQLAERQPQDFKPGHNRTLRCYLFQ